MARKLGRVTAFVSLVLLAGAAVVGFGAGLAFAGTINLKNTENFTDFAPDLPTKILDINGELITEFASEEKREIISLDELPPHMIQALLAREDQTFYNHLGFSVKSIARAVVGVVTRRSLGGGSTITQQLAGTLYLDRNERTITRKIKELWWALQLERRYSKEEILELYMNKMYFGGGTYGVDAASKYYFGHSASEITPAEAAILVIQLSNPAYYNPFNHPNRAMERQRDVLSQMVELGYIGKDEAERSYDDYWATFDYTRTATSVWLNREDKARWFSEYVRRQLEQMMYGTMDLYSGGYTVHTTLDLRQQRAAEEVMAEYIETANRRFVETSSSRFAQGDKYAEIAQMIALVFNFPRLDVSAERLHVRALARYRDSINAVTDMASLLFGLDELKTAANASTAAMQQRQARTTVEGALITLENDSGYITALVGGSQFNEANQVIRATQAQVQPGSSFKPLIYSAAIDSRKYTAGTVMNDTPVVFYNEDGVPYTPLNFRGEWKGTVLLWEALATSMNVPTVRLLDSIGFDAAIDRAAALLGYTDKEEIERVFPRVYPLALGIISVTPMQMAKAFATFENQGREVVPIAIRSVEDRNGRVIIDAEREVRLEQRRKGSSAQIVSPQNAYVMTTLLQNTFTAGTLGNVYWSGQLAYRDANGNRYRIPAAGKTGTTQNWRDAWTVGYTPYYTTAIWFGFDSPGYSLGLRSTGATLAAPAWGKYMDEIHEGLPYRDFIKPQTGLVEASVCRKSGLLRTDACTDGAITLTYLEGTQPEQYCEYHVNSAELKRTAVERLENEAFATGTAPQTVRTGELLIDPDIFDDPQPSARAQATLRRRQRSLSTSGSAAQRSTQSSTQRSSTQRSTQSSTQRSTTQRSTQSSTQRSTQRTQRTQRSQRQERQRQGSASSRRTTTRPNASTSRQSVQQEETKSTQSAPSRSTEAQREGELNYNPLLD